MKATRDRRASYTPWLCSVLTSRCSNADGALPGSDPDKVDFWCPEGDLNPHPRRDRILSPARLPDFTTWALCGPKPKKLERGAGLEPCGNTGRQPRIIRICATLQPTRKRR